MPRSDDARIGDIIAAAERIAIHIGQRDRTRFVADDTVMRAVLFDLAVIGEAAKGISASTRTKYPSVPWSEMAGLRDVVIHQYFGIDANVVWRAATVSVPTVVVVLRDTS